MQNHLCHLEDIIVESVCRLWPACSPQVALKVIKHCQEEGSSSELVTGFLVGLVVGSTLEITNCFPLPKELDDQEEESKYTEGYCGLPVAEISAWVWWVTCSRDQCMGVVGYL